MSAQRCDELRLTGSGGANRVMEAELKRLVMRSPSMCGSRSRSARAKRRCLPLRRPRRLGGGVLSPHLFAHHLGPLLERCRPLSRSSPTLCRCSPPTTGFPRKRKFALFRGGWLRSDFEASPLSFAASSRTRLSSVRVARRGGRTRCRFAGHRVRGATRGNSGRRRTFVGIDIGGGRVIAAARAWRWDRRRCARPWPRS